jgi:cardiolipin synthase A/B
MPQRQSYSVSEHEEPAHKRKEKGKPGWLGFFRKLCWSWWLWIALAITFEMTGHRNWALGSAMVALFLYVIAPRERIPHFGLESKFPVNSHEFLTSVVGATGSPFVQHNKVTVLNNGDQFYPAMLEAIRSARKTVTMEMYIFWKGDIGRQFAEALAERSRAGVSVKLLLDAFGSFTIGREIRKLLKESGCVVSWYNRIWLTTLGHFNHRTHRKTLVVDGRVAFTGGAGIADQWKGNGENREHWHDIQVRVEGPGAMGLQSGFAQNWLETKQELLSGEGYFPPPDSAGTIATQTILSSPENASSTVRIMYYLAIMSARKTIHLANPYFIPDDSAVQVLVDASKRGVDVKIMVAGIHNDMRISRYASTHCYGKLLEAGIEIYEYHRTMLHQKTMVADSTWSTIGTTNFDNRSFALHEESNICTYDRRIAEQLESIFQEDLKHCERVSLEEWRRRGWKKRFFGSICVFLKEQI